MTHSTVSPCSSLVGCQSGATMLGFSGCRGAPGYGGAWCKRGGVGRGSHTPRRKASRCVSTLGLKENLCGEGGPDLLRPRWTWPATRKIGAFHLHGLGLRRVRQVSCSLVCCGGGMEVDTTRIVWHLVAGYRSAIAHVSACKKEHIKLGCLWTAALEWEL